MSNTRRPPCSSAATASRERGAIEYAAALPTGKKAVASRLAAETPDEGCEIAGEARLVAPSVNGSILVRLDRPVEAARAHVMLRRGLGIRGVTQQVLGARLQRSLR